MSGAGLREVRDVRIERPTCCWTRCDNEQGAGTWTEINGETLPICEEHWYGNLDAERRRLRDYAERMDALAEERLVEIVRLRRAVLELGRRVPEQAWDGYGDEEHAVSDETADLYDEVRRG